MTLLCCLTLSDFEKKFNFLTKVIFIGIYNALHQDKKLLMNGLGKLFFTKLLYIKMHYKH